MKKRILALCLLLLCIVGIAGSLSAAQMKAAYRLKASATVPGPKVFASEVLEPVPDGDLAKVSFGRVGKPGSVQALTIEQVRNRLRRRLRGKAPQVEGHRCVVTASKQLLKGDKIVAFARAYLEKRLQNISGTARVKVSVGNIPRDIKVPDRQVTLSIASSARLRLRGNVVLVVKATQQDSAEKEIPVASVPTTFKVKVEEKVLVAVKAIKRKRPLTVENTELQWRDTTFARDSGFRDLSEVEGYKARRSIAVGSVIAQRLVDLPPVVSKGDIVYLQVRIRGVQLEVQATALEDGQQDEMIKVEVIGKKKRMMARVLNAATVIKVAR